MSVTSTSQNFPFHTQSVSGASGLIVDRINKTTGFCPVCLVGEPNELPDIWGNNTEIQKCYIWIFEPKQFWVLCDAASPPVTGVEFVLVPGILAADPQSFFFTTGCLKVLRRRALMCRWTSWRQRYEREGRQGGMLDFSYTPAEETLRKLNIFACGRDETSEDVVLGHFSPVSDILPTQTTIDFFLCQIFTFLKIIKSPLFSSSLNLQVSFQSQLVEHWSLWIVLQVGCRNTSW